MQNWSLFTHLSCKLRENKDKDKSKVPTSYDQKSQLPPFLFLDLKRYNISTPSFFSMIVLSKLLYFLGST